MSAPTWYQRRGKRLLDASAAGAGLLVLSPILAAVALLLKLLDRGPVFFRQTRAGRGFVPFTIYKFRSMRVGARGLQITKGRDARVTPLGAFLRKTKLDELPQLYNVLRGDMSLVGPRPTVPKYAEMYRGDYEVILSVRPGLTDYASIKYRDEEDVLEVYDAPEAGYMDDILPDKMALYRRYIAESGLATDLKILVATFLKIAGVRLSLLEEPASLPGGPVVVRRRRRVDDRVVMTALDFAAVVAAYAAAFVLRFDFQMDARALRDFSVSSPYALSGYAVMSYYFAVNRGLRYYASFGDVLDILKASGSAAVLLAAAAWALHGMSVPRAVLALWPILSLTAVAGLHAGIRALRHHFKVHLLGDAERRSAVIVGVGDLGELVYQNLRSHPDIDYRIAAFFDAERGRCGVRLHGVPVIGGAPALSEVVRRSGVDEILVAVDREARAKALAVVADALQGSERRPGILVMPAIDEMRKSAAPPEPRRVQPGDLLTRRVVPLDVDRIARALGGKTVLVTGAGGTIGGELCRQALLYKPRKLILLDNNASSLFVRETELRQEAQGVALSVALGDLRDQGVIDRVFADPPAIVFHAAAHKHIHQLETNVHEAVNNNLLATYRLAAAAKRAGVETFLLLSTDKASRPGSVMAATKRASETVIAAFARSSSTRFASVRFGNVLGSSGSVLKIFQEQIEKGRPLTLTHPDAARYFMTVEEAAGLLLQAAVIAKGGETFVLKMGEQIRIMDIARSLVRLSGLDPDRDVQIRFVGLGAGETLSSEDIMADPPGHERSDHPAILAMPFEETVPEELASTMAKLEILCRQSPADDLIRELARLLPPAQAPEMRLRPLSSTGLTDAPAS
jgi:FlaA1/EpsC-like NDP-sugar epimerase/lipopolysaccharide/colanic/teichoic acid biosynthesis glycosyltransferase